MSSTPRITTFGSVLVANRGEIALRVIRSARAAGLRTVAVYSDADRAAPHVRAADAAVRIGPAAASQSYLCIPALLDAARRSGADAVHPGYGFLSERADFARAVTEAGLVFVGPSADVMHRMGRKDHAREIAAAAGVPVVPAARIDGTHVDAGEIGLPLLVKAAAGGGGKGMRIVRDAAELPEALAAARREAHAAFGDGTVLVERFVERGRHVEVQVLADRHGAVLHLGERDCSAQRRHQKVIEEAPAPTISPALRRTLTDAAVALARAVGYTNAGTVEFLVDGENAYFLEMNTRLQVEHPVTELVTGLDLVGLQLLVADGQALPFGQDDVTVSGHAIEARVYAEDAFSGFLPQAGTARYVRWPAHARVDAALEPGQVVGTDYDPMLGKIVVHGPTREAARRSLMAALDDTAVLGVTTNLGFLRGLAASEAFGDAAVDTTWLDRHAGAIAVEGESTAALIGAWALARVQPASASPFCRHDGWRMTGPPAPTVVELVVDGKTRSFSVHGNGLVTGDGRSWQVAPVAVDLPSIEVEIDGRLQKAYVRLLPHRVEVAHLGHTFVLTRPDRFGPGGHHEPADGAVVAPMPGSLTDVRVEPGQAVRAGEVLGVLEAMKMEFPLSTPIDGTVVRVRAAPGTQVDLGTLLFLVEGEEHG